MIITAAALALINILCWFLLLPKIINKKISRFQNDLVDRHYDEVEIMYRKMRGWRHDYHNHIQVLKAYLELSQYSEAKEYLGRLEENLAEVDTVLKTGNIMADAILNSKLTLIAEKRIKVDATAFVPHDIPVSGIDLSVLIGNLLDNAMEACCRIDNPQKRFIRIYIDILKKQFYISITNSMQERKAAAGNRFVSEKAGNHGFGLLRVDSIVAKYHGYINRQTEEGVFATEVTIPMTGIKTEWNTTEGNSV